MKKSVLLITIIVCLIAFATSSHATPISWDLDYEFSGGTLPASDPPWLRATFDDDIDGLTNLNPANTINTVSLTMEALNLTGGEFVGAWYFNYADDKSIGGITWEAPVISVGTGRNSFNVAGGGWFDIEIIFKKPNGSRFGPGSSTEVYFSGVGLDAESFNLLSEPSGDNGTYHTAAHVQAIGLKDESGWIGDAAPIPEPATLLLLGAGLIGLAGFGRKKLNK